MIITNHTYDVVGAYVDTKEMGGGSFEIFNNHLSIKEKR